MTKKPSLRVVGIDRQAPPHSKTIASFLEQEERDELIANLGLDAVRKMETMLREHASKLAEERQPKYETLFPGTPERARRLGRVYEKLHDTLLGTMFSLSEQDRQELRTALEPVLPFLTGRAAASNQTIQAAPILWAERGTGLKTNPAKFTRETYARWLGNGLTRQRLRELDPQLYHALSVWEHRHPEDRIEELPTMAEVIDSKIALLAAEFSPDELRKLGTTLQTRLRRSKK